MSLACFRSSGYLERRLRPSGTRRRLFVLEGVKVAMKKTACETGVHFND